MQDLAITKVNKGYVLVCYTHTHGAVGRQQVGANLRTVQSLLGRSATAVGEKEGRKEGRKEDREEETQSLEGIHEDETTKQST